MTVRVASLLDTPGRPELVTGTASLSMVSGGATLIGASLVVTVVFTSVGADWFPIAAALLAVIQVSAGLLLIVGGARLAAGAGRGALVVGVELQFLTCAVYALYAVTEVADNPEDAPEMVVVILTVAGLFAVVAAACLYLACGPTTTAFLSVTKASGGTGTRPGVRSGGSA